MAKRLCFFFAAVVAAAWLGGCAAPELSGERALERGPLPYDVGIFVDESELGFAGVGESEEDAVAVVAYRATMDDLLGTLQRELAVERTVVSRVRRLTARDRATALQEAGDLDLLLAVGLETPSELASTEWPWPWATLEIVTWLFGGIPSWYVPSVRYPTDTHLRVEALDLHRPAVRSWYDDASDDAPPPEFDWSAELHAPFRDVSLHDRSWILDRPTDYLLTIVAPPVVLAPGDVERLNARLTEGIHQELGGRLAETLREKILAADPADWDTLLSVAFIAPNPLRVVDSEQLELVLGVASLGDSPIGSLEVECAPSFRWTASRVELDLLADEIRTTESPGDHVRLVVPEPVPLEPGANVVKVRMERRDGERLVRTMVYYR